MESGHNIQSNDQQELSNQQHQQHPVGCCLHNANQLIPVYMLMPPCFFEHFKQQQPTQKPTECSGQLFPTTCCNSHSQPSNHPINELRTASNVTIGLDLVKKNKKAPPLHSDNTLQDKSINTDQQESNKSLTLHLEQNWDDSNVNENECQHLKPEKEDKKEKEEENGDDDDQPEKENTPDLLKKARVLLNQLSTDNWKSAFIQLRELELINRDQLVKLIDLVFDKATTEPDLCIKYAGLFQVMNLNTVPDGGKKKVSFGKLLIQKCQTVFESDIYKGIDLMKREEEVHNCTNVEKKYQLMDKLDVDKAQARRRYLNNIKLIGELNNVGMLNVKIMLFCIDKLLLSPDDDTLEAVCILLQTIGKTFEIQMPIEYKQVYNGYLNKLRSFVKQNKASSRINQMILNFLELRKNNWIVPAQNASPTTSSKKQSKKLKSKS